MISVNATLLLRFSRSDNFLPNPRPFRAQRTERQGTHVIFLLGAQELQLLLMTQVSKTKARGECVITIIICPKPSK
uniref:Uncharacterized protein n=1 Tax=Ascaris lumbricoides TaxID=6252 RepID=A0A0M3I0Q9_ASCLU